MSRVWVVGSINLDLVVRVDRLPRPGETITAAGIEQGLGGKGANQAVAAARLGAAVSMLGAVGDDDAGERLLAMLAAEGVDTADIATVAGATGTAIVAVDAHGENAIVVVPGANAEVVGRLDRCERGDVVVAQGEIPLSATTAALAAGRGRGATTIWNPAPATPAARDQLALADVVVVNETELEILTGSIAAMRDLGVANVIVTLGARGVRADLAGVHVELAARPVHVVDTTGAGDCFVGALAARLALGSPLSAAIETANLAASLAVGRRGASASMPRAADLDEVSLS